MASLILKMSISLDGFVDSSDGSNEWVTTGRSEDSGAFTLETVSGAGTHLIGAETYRRWVNFWPNAPEPFAKPMNETPKVVFSNTLESAEWGPTEIVRGDIAAGVARLKEERDGYLLAQGGVRFTRSLVETGLIDEYRLVVHPVVLGAGEKLFTEPLDLEPVSTTAFSGGAVAHVFKTRS